MRASIAPSSTTMMDPSIQVAGAPEELPTALCSVVWSRGHCFVREGTFGRSRWVGVDDHGRPQSLTDAEMHRRGWSLRRS